MLGRSTGAFCSISGMTTMKMISSTSTTSTSGVTFITGLARRRALARALMTAPAIVLSLRRRRAERSGGHPGRRVLGGLAVRTTLGRLRVGLEPVHQLTTRVREPLLVVADPLLQPVVEEHHRDG